MKPHKHAELIKQWADGAEVQIKLYDDWFDIPEPIWRDNQEYRIKPAGKVVRWLWSYKDRGEFYINTQYLTEAEAAERFTSSYNRTNYNKLEWSRQEFDE